MRPAYTLGQDGAAARLAPEAVMPPNLAPTVREIPYDYVAAFTLDGNRPGNRVPDVINISTDGAFVAVAIGYSFVPKQVNRADGQGNTSLDRLLAIAQAIAGDTTLLRCLMVRLCGIDFKYSIVDSGSGRELQNRQIHNIAGLGEPNGNRPFRPFAKPMLFMPRSTIRIEVEEISEGPMYIGAELFIVLHGYKMLGYGTGLP